MSYFDQTTRELAHSPKRPRKLLTSKKALLSTFPSTYYY
jgi:hypothetical protein